MTSTPAPRPTKHRRVFESLHREILAGSYADGRLPGEAELAIRFRTSRPTIARALEGLRQQGFIERRQGAGTFLRRSAPAESRILGLIGAGIGHTEILRPLGPSLVRAAEAAGCRIICGDAGQREQDAEALAREFLARGVCGVLLAPLERIRARELANRRLVAAFARVGIPLVLLDRDILEFPARSGIDLVAVDDVRAGCVLAAHLLRGGRRQLTLLARPGYPSTTELRLAGCRAGAAAVGATATLVIGDPADPRCAAQLIDSGTTIACANDATAVSLMTTFLADRRQLPRGLRIGGFDDVGGAAAAPVPLTTMHLPIADLGRVAVGTLLERLRDPNSPPRQILLDTRLVIRCSSR